MIRDKEGLSYWERKIKGAAEAGDTMSVIGYSMHYRLDLLSEQLEKFAYPNKPSRWQLIRRWKQYRLYAEYGKINFDLGLIDHVVFNDEP